MIDAESVVLPQLHDPFEEGSWDVDIRQAEDCTTPWNQPLRVGYRKG